MEGTSYVRDNSLILSCDRGLRVKLEGLCKVYKDFFDGLTIIQHTFLKHCKRVAVHFRSYHHPANAVYKGRQKFILQRRIIHDNRTDFTEGFRIWRSKGYIVPISVC